VPRKRGRPKETGAAAGESQVSASGPRVSFLGDSASSFAFGAGAEDGSLPPQSQLQHFPASYMSQAHSHASSAQSQPQAEPQSSVQSGGTNAQSNVSEGRRGAMREGGGDDVELLDALFDE
jgi:hypothetical protein